MESYICAVEDKTKNIEKSVDKEGSEKAIKVSDTTPRRGISSRRKRRSYGHVRRNIVLEQLSLW